MERAFGIAEKLRFDLGADFAEKKEESFPVVPVDPADLVDLGALGDGDDIDSVGNAYVGTGYVPTTKVKCACKCTGHRITESG